MSKKGTFRLVGYWVCVLLGLGGCEGSTSGSAPDSGVSTEGGETGEKYMRTAQTEDGKELVCKYVAPSSSPQAVQCVDKHTGQPYECKMFPDESTYKNCIPKPQSETWTPPCENYKQFGDHKSGLQCWEPPENYCKEGANTVVTWFCRQDASKCCLVGGDCFRCGWVDMMSCLVAGELEVRPPSFCEDIRSKLAEPYKSCIEDQCSNQELEQIRKDPECNAPEPSLLICEG